MATSSTSPTPGESKASTTPTSEAPATEAPATAPATAADLDAIFGGTSDGSRPALDELKGIKYIGSSDTRSISKADFERAGIENVKGDLSWTPENGYLVPISSVNAATADYLYADADFELV